MLERRGAARALLIGLTLLVVGAGIGLRDPWPPDEPRYVLVGKQMAETGYWLIPHRGIEAYAEKPPLFFWLMGSVYRLTGSLNLTAVLPSLLAGLGVLLLVFDLGARLWSTRVGLLAALGLLSTIQFVWQARVGQIDMVLCLTTTLSLYALLRHSQVAPDLRLWLLAWAAAGLGIMTKGVGFLPLLALLPIAALRRAGWPGLAPRLGSPLETAAGPLALAGVLAAWLVPLLLVIDIRGSEALFAYRDDLLLRQTVTRYGDAWAHREPWWYLWQQALGLWLPLTLLLPWLLSRWWRRLRARDARIAVLLGWLILVLLFFSVSSGKRGVYILPALPALALAAAPFVDELLRRRDVARLSVISAMLLCGGLSLAAAFAGWITPALGARWLADYPHVEPWGFALTAGLCGLALSLLLAWRRCGAMTLPAVLGVLWLLYGWWGMPMLDSARSSRELMQSVAQQIGPEAQLAVADWKEQLLLFADRPVTDFGFSRPVDEQMADASTWLRQHPSGWLLTQREAALKSFAASRVIDLGIRHRRHWVLVAPAVAAVQEDGG